MPSRYPYGGTCTTCSVVVGNLKSHLASTNHKVNEILRRGCALPNESNTADYAARMIKSNRYIDSKLAGGGYKRLGFWSAADPQDGNNDSVPSDVVQDQLEDFFINKCQLPSALVSRLIKRRSSTDHLQAMAVVVCAGLTDKPLEAFNSWLNNSSLGPTTATNHFSLGPSTATSQVVSLSARELSKQVTTASLARKFVTVKKRFLQALGWTEERFVDWICTARLDVQDPRCHLFFMMYGIETGLVAIDGTHKSDWSRIRFRPLSFATAFVTGDDDLGLKIVDAMDHVRSVFPSSTTMQEVERNMLFEDRSSSSPAWKAFFAYVRAAESSTSSTAKLTNENLRNRLFRYISRMAVVDDTRSGTPWTRKEKGQLRNLLKAEKVGFMKAQTYLWCCSASDVIKTRTGRAIQAYLQQHRDDYF
ncbi:hypothetical protein HD553DRAFT_155409 [Filobasidium floriforme]|uniref:uncharacterized protein n=1 Tax=Filobasidium floriforme TaxID=5210 RepID=UPI001E8CC37C|nr:uncharacterized protein HD553DRAFT_155409 [Filobasidium floriforme]KAH8089109.1 hypothetical protein HD553DRAFT_155409 [Filobasidium floriforme]